VRIAAANNREFYC